MLADYGYTFEFIRMAVNVDDHFGSSLLFVCRMPTGPSKFNVQRINKRVERMRSEGICWQESRISNPVDIPSRVTTLCLTPSSCLQKYSSSGSEYEKCPESLHERWRVTPNPSVDQAGSPTADRWIVLAMVAFAAASAYLTRYCISAANTTMQKDLGFNNAWRGLSPQPNRIAVAVSGRESFDDEDGKTLH